MVPFLIAVALAAAWCWSLRWVGAWLGFVERPGEDELKTHSVPAVPFAGPGILVGLALGSYLMGGSDLRFLPGLALLTALGVVDDRFQLAPGVRLLIEAVAAAVIATVWWEYGPVYAIGGAMAVVLAVNAVNLYDGIDLLAGSTGVVSLAAAALVANSFGLEPTLPLIGAAALLGFLPFNLPPARVFLGDGGAYLLGGVVAVSMWSIGVSRGAVDALASLGLLGMFAVDLVVTILRRLWSRQSLFAGDRSHLYDLLVAAGKPVYRVVGMLLLAHAAALGLVAIVLIATEPIIALLVVAVLGLTAVALAWRVAVSLSSRGRLAPPAP